MMTIIKKGSNSKMKSDKKLNHHKELDWFHLKNTNETYWKHLTFGLKWGLFLILTGFIGIIHAIIPFIFTFRPSKNVLKIAQKVEEKHPYLK